LEEKSRKNSMETIEQAINLANERVYLHKATDRKVMVKVRTTEKKDQKRMRNDEEIKKIKIWREGKEGVVTLNPGKKNENCISLTAKNMQSNIINSAVIVFKKKEERKGNGEERERIEN
jgi:hypothetical protein